MDSSLLYTSRAYYVQLLAPLLEDFAWGNAALRSSAVAIDSPALF